MAGEHELKLFVPELLFTGGKVEVGVAVDAVCGGVPVGEVGGIAAVDLAGGIADQCLPG
jgi:hypothetical protein